MKKKKALVFGIFLSVVLYTSFCIPNLSLAQGSITGWSKTFPNIIQDHSTCSAIQTNEGGYAIASTSSSSDFLLLKVDAQGSVKWTKSYAIEGDNDAQSLIQTSEGGYAIGGLSRQNTLDGGFRSEFLLVKISSTGIMQWTKTYQQISGETTLVVQTEDNGFAFVGSGIGIDDGRGISLIRVDSLGNVLWNQTYYNQYVAYSQSLIETLDKGFAITIHVSNSTGGFSSMILVDSSGNLNWAKTYSRTGDSTITSVVQTNDGGYTLAGSTERFVTGENSGNNVFDAWLIHVDSVGNQQWDRTYGQTKGSMSAYSLVQTGDGGYAFAGSVESNRTTFYSGFEFDFCLVKVDASGELQWSKIYGGERRNLVRSLIRPQDGGYVLMGTKDNFGNEDLDYYILMVRTDEQGEPSIEGLSLTVSSALTSDSSALTASLSESASALNYGNKVNFTAMIEGGKAPYTYEWYLDNQLVQTTATPYYSTNSQAVGSHHMYVKVTDANNNSATTLTVEFNILPTSSSSPLPSPSVPEFPFFTVLSLIAVSTLVGAILHKKRICNRK